MSGITVMYDLVTELWCCDTVHCDNFTEKMKIIYWLDHTRNWTKIGRTPLKSWEISPKLLKYLYLSAMLNTLFSEKNRFCFAFLEKSTF